MLRLAERGQRVCVDAAPVVIMQSLMGSVCVCVLPAPRCGLRTPSRVLPCMAQVVQLGWGHPCKLGLAWRLRSLPARQWDHVWLH